MYFKTGNGVLCPYGFKVNKALGSEKFEGDVSLGLMSVLLGRSSDVYTVSCTILMKILFLFLILCCLGVRTSQSLP